MHFISEPPIASENIQTKEIHTANRYFKGIRVVLMHYIDARINRWMISLTQTQKEPYLSRPAGKQQVGPDRALSV